MDNQEAKELIEATTWYHEWEILPGVNTGGGSITDPRKVLDRYGVPQDLTGLTALDIGAWDGPYSFELERRGATVTSYDIQDPNATAYNTAKKILNSSNTYVQGSVYDLRAEKLGQFDIVLYLGVFYHLKHPMAAWNRIREVLKPDGTMFYEGAILDWAYKVDKPLEAFKDQIDAVKELPITYFAVGNYATSWSNWYIPTGKCVNDWLLASGFHEIEMGFIENSSRAYGSAKLDLKADLIEHGMSNANAKATGDQDAKYIPEVE